MSIETVIYITLTILFIFFVAIQAIRMVWKPLPSRVLLAQFIKAQYHWWLKQKRHRHQLIKNIAVGIVIGLILHSFHDAPLIRHKEDAAFDWVMAMMVRITPVGSVPGRVPQKFVFLDIDEATYRNWGEPLYIPRNKLLDIIQYAVNGNPAIIIVDVDLSWCGLCPDQDLALASFLNTYYAQNKLEDKKNLPPIILPQTFREPIEGESEARRTSRELFFKMQDYGEQSRVFSGSPLFELDENDLHLRHWRLWEIASNHEVIPSVELSAVALLYKTTQETPNLNPAAVIQEVKQELNKLTKSDSPKINIPGIGALKTDSEDIGQRIIYSIPGILEKGKAYPDNFVRRSVLPITKNFFSASDQNLVDLSSTQCPVQCLTPSKVIHTEQSDPSWLNKSVVVIGASFGNSRDIYATPIGPMPGAMVIVNAINSLYVHKQINKTPGYITIFWEIVLILVMSVAFIKLDTFKAMLACFSIIMVIMLPISFLYFKDGVWLDFAIPTLAVYIHHLHTKFEEMQKCSSKHDSRTKKS